jgi:hypothetical protein
MSQTDTEGKEDVSTEKPTKPTKPAKPTRKVADNVRKGPREEASHGANQTE